MDHYCGISFQSIAFNGRNLLQPFDHADNLVDVARRQSQLRVGAKFLFDLLRRQRIFKATARMELILLRAQFRRSF